MQIINHQVRESFFAFLCDNTENGILKWQRDEHEETYKTTHNQVYIKAALDVPYPYVLSMYKKMKTRYRLLDEDGQKLSDLIRQHAQSEEELLILQQLISAN